MYIYRFYLAQFKFISSNFIPCGVCFMPAVNIEVLCFCLFDFCL
uniref:Uncharacterized protein n=1 Tax=Arundo donax TaxID=35708 RepID=A0A0A8YVG1_ARUDO